VHFSLMCRRGQELRAKFHKMCANLGVDPLTSSKDMWSTLGMGAFYFELAVRVVEVRVVTGGISRVPQRHPSPHFSELVRLTAHTSDCRSHLPPERSTAASWTWTSL